MTTQTEIIEMAKQSGIWFVTDREDLILDFAKLVEDAAFKRWAAQTKLAVQDEREACAAKAEQVGQHKNHIGIAAAIRARGEA